MKKLCNLANSRFPLLELWNTIWHSYRVYKELKPQHFNSIKTRTVNNNNTFYPPYYNDWIILATIKNPKLHNYQCFPYTRENNLFSITCTYLPGSSLCSTKRVNNTIRPLLRTTYYSTNWPYPLITSLPWQQNDKPIIDDLPLTLSMMLWLQIPRYWSSRPWHAYLDADWLLCHLEFICLMLIGWLEHMAHYYSPKLINISDLLYSWIQLSCQDL